MLSCHTCLPTVFSPKNILYLISFILSMFGHCWRFLISQSNLNFWVGYGRNLWPWWTRPPRSCHSLCKTLARFLKTNQFSKSLNFRKTPRKQCDHEDFSTWKPFSTVIRASEKKTSYEKEPILHLTQIQSARNGLTKPNEFSSKLNMKQPEIT